MPSDLPVKDYTLEVKFTAAMIRDDIYNMFPPDYWKLYGADDADDQPR